MTGCRWELSDCHGQTNKNKKHITQGQMLLVLRMQEMLPSNHRGFKKKFFFTTFKFIRLADLYKIKMDNKMISPPTHPQVVVLKYMGFFVQYLILGANRWGSDGLFFVLSNCKLLNGSFQDISFAICHM